MIYRLDDNKVGFPDPRLAEPDGLVAFGGGMTTEWLLNAYYFGLFPWYAVDGMPHWYSPDPRTVLFPKDFHCSKSLRRQLRSGRFEVRVDSCFRDVIVSCASVARDGQTGTSWIDSQFIEAYCDLHDAGFAHSFETFLDGRLVGGLYGVGLSDYFCGESMFHTVTDASKVAFAKMVEFATMHHFRFIDTQMHTEHLASLGATQIPQEEFLGMLDGQDFEKTYRGKWADNSAVLLLGSNEGDRIAILARAMMEIANEMGVVSVVSPVYETASWGYESSNNYLNMAVVVDTELTADEVLERALEIERRLGRVRNGEEAVGGTRKYSDRPIDIDLIFFNSEVIDRPELTVPHPRMQERRFVLVPLAEIMPDYRHPKLKKTVSELLKECSDQGKVKHFF